MQELSYESTPFAVRADLVAAHRRAWERLARPGGWWSGADRVAIAAETRHALDCGLCRERQAALSPYVVDGEHGACTDLPAPVVDAIHRIRTDPGRLTKPWFDALLAQELTDAAYIEVLGVVVTVVTVDTFARAIGATLPPLPQPLAGAPSRVHPGGLSDGGAWVPMLRPADASGPEADLYGGDAFVPNVRRAMSLVPPEARGWLDLSLAHYVGPGQLMDPGASNRAITRPQIELLAARVSALNGCFY